MKYAFLFYIGQNLPKTIIIGDLEINGDLEDSALQVNNDKQVNSEEGIVNNKNVCHSCETKQKAKKQKLEIGY